MRGGRFFAGLFCLLMLSQAAVAEVTWDSVVSKAQKAKDYEVVYKFEGARGKFDFKYAFAGDKIRTEILRSEPDRTRKGTVLIWDKGWDAGRIRAKTGGGLITRKIDHKDVEDTPFYRSLFDMIFEQTKECGKPSAKASGGETIFTFKCPGGSYKVWANADSEITRTERIIDNEKETRKFLGHKWNSNPKTDW